MKKILIIVVLMVICLHVGCRKNGSGGVVPDSATLNSWIRKRVDFIIIDVRTRPEYESGHIPTAVNIPLSDIAADPSIVSKGKLLVLYCRSGNRSGQAQVILRQAGYKKLINFGGLYRWKGKRATGSSPGTL